MMTLELDHNRLDKVRSNNSTYSKQSGSNLTWDRSRQTIVAERQRSCRMKHDTLELDHNRLDKVRNNNSTYSKQSRFQSHLELFPSNYCRGDTTELSNET